jgi:hypothetical protein
MSNVVPLAVKDFSTLFLKDKFQLHADWSDKDFLKERMFSRKVECKSVIMQVYFKRSILCCNFTVFIGVQGIDARGLYRALKFRPAIDPGIS